MIKLKIAGCKAEIFSLSIFILRTLLFIKRVNFYKLIYIINSFYFIEYCLLFFFYNFLKFSKIYAKLKNFKKMNLKK